MQPDESILNDLTPESDLLEVDPPALSRCFDHGAAGCAECSERLARAREIEVARRKQETQPAASQTSLMADIKLEQPSTAALDVVRLAEQFARLEEQLNRERQQLTAAESRVEFLQASIGASEAAVESARKALIDYLATIG
jgi:hypothetical protein